MLTILFATGVVGSIDNLRHSGLYRYVTLCRKSPELKWADKDGSVKCELRSYNVRTTSVAELLLFIETLEDYVDKRTTMIYVVELPDEINDGDGDDDDENLCECSLSVCKWCREQQVREQKPVKKRAKAVEMALLAKKNTKKKSKRTLQ